MSERDARLLTDQLRALEKANQEVAGDADSEEEVGMGELDVDDPALKATADAATAEEEEEECRSALATCAAAAAADEEEEG